VGSPSTPTGAEDGKVKQLERRVLELQRIADDNARRAHRYGFLYFIFIVIILLFGFIYLF
jgi:hypothetical protein